MELKLHQAQNMKNSKMFFLGLGNFWKKNTHMLIAVYYLCVKFPSEIYIFIQAKEKKYKIMYL